MTVVKQIDKRTDWLTVWIAVFGGAAAAMQVGKAGAALPAIRAEYGFEVGTLALYVSLLSLVAATLGLGFGMMTRRIGQRRAAMAGLLILTIASLIPVVVAGGGALLISRVIEALGFALCTTSLPALVRAAATPRRQSLAMGLWAAWMPAGVVLSLGAAAITIDPLGWRALFVICAMVPFLAFVAFHFMVRAPSTAPPEALRLHLRETLLRLSVARTTGIFILFSGANMVYMGFLPTMLVEEHGMELTRANQLTLISVLCLIPFNLGTGWALDRGISATWLYVVAFMVMAASPVLILWSSTTPVVTWLGAILFGAAAGVVPSIVWAQVPRLARSSDEAPSVSGLIYQGAGIGQIIGPLAAGAAVEFTGNWLGPAGVIGGFCILGVIFAFLKTSRVHRVG